MHGRTPSIKMSMRNVLDDQEIRRISGGPKVFYLHPLPPETIMGEALDVIKQGYEAFGRRDIPALLKLVAEEVDWKEACPASLPYSGLRRNPAEVAEFFAAVDRAEDITVFEARELRPAKKSRYWAT
jgi:hypothetical protein